LLPLVRHCHPAVAGEVDEDLGHLRRSQPLDPLVGPDVVVVDLHPRAELVCPDLVRQAAHHLCPLPEGAVQPPRDVVVGLGLEVLQPEVGVLDERGLVTKHVLNCILICLKAVRHHKVGPPCCYSLRLV